MKRTFLLLTIISLAIVARAQESSDFGFFLGSGMEHATTILPIPAKTTIGLPALYPAAGVFYRKNSNPRYGLRTGLNYGFNPPYYAELQLTQAPVFPENPQLEAMLLPADLHALVEFNFLPLDPRYEKPKVTTFVAAGLGISQLRPSIPFHVGVKYRATEKLGLSLEWAIRKKLMGEGLSTNWFSYLGVKANYTILKTCKTCPFYESAKKKKKR